MNQKTEQIEIENIGPIERLSIPVSPGTITVLKGPNGSGKSQALGAVKKLTTGGGSLTSRDGTVGGTASGFGVNVKVNRNGANRRKTVDEELHVESLEDSLNIADLVDPVIKDQTSADDRRIKALVSLAGVDPDVSLFAQLAEGIDDLVSFDEIQTDSVVDMAAKVKRELESKARSYEETARESAREYKSLREQNKGIDIAAECDDATLQNSLEQALSDHAKMTQQVEDMRTTLKGAETARESLEDAKRNYDGPTVDEAKAKAADISSVLGDRLVDVKQLTAGLEIAKNSLEVAEKDAEASVEEIKAALNHQYLIEKWESAIVDAENVSAPEDEDVEAAHESLVAAREAQKMGNKIREALEREKSSAEHEVRFKEAESVAKRIRDAAGKVNGVLSTIVQGMAGPFSVDNDMRLVVDHSKRGSCYYSDLSHGERWKLGLDVAISAFVRTGERGLLCIPQEAYESLDGTNRKIIADHIRGTDLAIITAEASRGESTGLEAETLEETS